MGIRTKLVIAFAGLLLIVAVVGVLSVHTLNESSLAIERILRENFDTVAACDHMKVALERLDRQAELCLWEDRPEVCKQSQPVLDEFDQNLRIAARQPNGFFHVPNCLGLEPASPQKLGIPPMRTLVRRVGVNRQTEEALGLFPIGVLHRVKTAQ